MKVLKIIYKVFSYIIISILTLLLVFNLISMALRLINKDPCPTVFGFAAAVVISGSMEPEIGVNDLVIIKSQKSYETDEIITFKSNNGIVTHRIIEKIDTGFVTKGDANNTPDEDEVKSEDIVGEVILVIPKIGSVLEFFAEPLGMFLLVIVGFALVGVETFFNNKFEKKSDNESTK